MHDVRVEADPGHRQKIALTGAGFAAQQPDGYTPRLQAPQARGSLERVGPSPSSCVSTLAVPAGITATGTSVCTTPGSISLTVPSPPSARIKSAPSSTACLAMRPAAPSSGVGMADTPCPAARSASTTRPTRPARLPRNWPAHGLKIRRMFRYVAIALYNKQRMGKEAKAEIAELRETLRRHEHLYYVLDSPRSATPSTTN